MTKTIQIIYGSGQISTPASSVFYKVFDSAGNILIARTNTGVTAVLDNMNAATGTFTANVPNWNPNWIGHVTWDINGSNVQTVNFDFSLSLSSLYDANIYFNSRLYATIWNASPTSMQQQALNDATRILNRFAWKGQVQLLGQTHTWGRKNFYLDCTLIDGIPAQILEAQYEIAFALLKGYNPELDARSAGVISRGYSSVRVAYDPNHVAEYLLWGVPSAAAWNLMLIFLDDAAETIHLHRVS